MTEAEAVRLFTELLGALAIMGAAVLALFKWGFSKLSTKEDLVIARRETKDEIADVKQVIEETRELARATNGRANRNHDRLSHVEGFIQGFSDTFVPPMDDT